MSRRQYKINQSDFFFYEGVLFRSLVFSLKSQFDYYAMDSNTEWF